MGATKLVTAQGDKHQQLSSSLRRIGSLTCRKRPRTRIGKATTIFLGLAISLQLPFSSNFLPCYTAAAAADSNDLDTTNSTIIVETILALEKGENEKGNNISERMENNNIATSDKTDESSDITNKSNNKEPLLQKKSSENSSDRRGGILRIEDELEEHARILQAGQKDQEIALNQQQQQEHEDFMDWCKKVLGVQTSLEVHTFYYYDYMTALTTHPQNNIVEDDDDDFEIDTDEEAKEEVWEDPPLLPVRGLRATRNIAEGEIVISIPFQALLTVRTTIDQDPVLSRVMGPKARKAYGWTLGQDESVSPDNESDALAVDFFELPLLAMALLHHRRLGSSSPLFPYISILRSSPIDSMPYLWNKQKRREFHAYHSRISQGVETVARSIRQEMKEMYHTVVDTLVTNHPDLFGNDSKSKPQQFDVLEEDDWAFSFEKFQWAFAMVNSRHWLLPIVDVERKQKHEAKPPSTLIKQQQHPQGIVDGVPPAEMPTDAWLEQNQDDDDNDDKSDRDENEQPKGEQTKPGNSVITSSYHSFLAPVADLLNFGPPCTRGRYNQETHTFDIIASCNFTPGQEITFWYSDECEDIIIGNYGFTHPMVPKCPTAEEYRQKMDKWKKLATSLQDELADAYEDMDIIDIELQTVQRILADCDCCETDEVPAAYWMQHRQFDGEQQQQQQTQKEQRHQSAVVDQGDGFHANYLRNPQEKTSRQIRGGMMSRSEVGRRSERSAEERSAARSRSTKDSEGGRSRQTARGAASDDDVEHHGVRRMWAGRSGL